MGDFDEWAEEEERRGPVEPRGDVRAAYCRKVAQTLLKRAGVKEPPVPVEVLAAKAGLNIVKADLPRGVDATLRPVEGVIEVARDQAGVRRRFSIAHELGHHCLGHAHGDSSVAESQANIFAGALLAPGSWLRHDLPLYRTPDALAQRYQVSREVIFIALKDARLLNKIP